MFANNNQYQSMNLFRLSVLLFLFFFAPYAKAQSYNRELAAELDTIYKADQQYRSQHPLIGSKEDKENMDRQSVLDYKNLQKVEAIFARYGYPGKTLVGEKYMSAAFLVIQHNDLEAQEKYLPLLTRAAEKGELKSSSLAILIDRIKVGKGEKQVYGSQLRETGEGVKIMPVEDEPGVNIRRAEVGLPPLETYLKHWNINYRLPTVAMPNPPNPYFVQKEQPAVEAISGDEAILGKLLYPAKAKNNNISGYVTVEFTVDKEGNTKDITVVQPLGYGCDEEALRVMREAKYKNNTGEDHEMRMRLPFPNTKG